MTGDLTTWRTSGGQTSLWRTSGVQVAGIKAPSPAPAPTVTRTDPATLTVLRHVTTGAFKTPFDQDAAPSVGSTSVAPVKFMTATTGLRVSIHATSPVTGARAGLVVRGVPYELTVKGSPVFDVPGGLAPIITDTLPDTVWAEAGDTGQVRIWVPAGQKVPLGKAAVADGGVLGGDSHLGASTVGAASASWSPLAVIGRSSTGTRSVFLDGDSIMGTPWARNAVEAAGRAWTDRAQFGIQVGTFDPLLSKSVDAAPWTDFIWELGTNNTGQAQPGVYAKAIAAMYALADAGMRGGQTTLAPRTTSTDSWATTDSQTPSYSPEWRESWNAWVRDGSPVNSDRAWAAPGSTGVLRAGDKGHMLAYPPLDLAAALETGTADKRVWQPGKLTVDGTHLSDAGTALAQTAATAWVKKWLGGSA